MKLKRVWTQNITYICSKCGQKISKDVYADLDGKAFQSYVCSICMKIYMKEQDNET